MKSSFFHIAIDTGGTFTDCIATDPSGNILTCKVMSDSTLRGIVKKVVAADRFITNTHWQVQRDIFRAYTFSPTGTDKQAKVLAFDPITLIITLDTPLPSVTEGVSFTLTAHEEAPILAARLITQTPLNTPFPPLLMRLGSTKGTNALLEMKGAKTALLVTKGFKDLLVIGNQQRPDLFAINIQRPQPLYDIVFEINERLDKNGCTTQPLFTDDLNKIIKRLKKKGIKSLAIAFLHSYKNPEHEQQLRGVLANHFEYISLSSEMSGQIKIVPRAETTVVNAYLAPIIRQYIRRITTALPDGALTVMTSAGSLVNAHHFLPKDSLLSGPAGGIVGAAYIGQSLGFQSLITFDMGGTSTDVARYDGDFDYVYETKIGAATVFSTALNIETVAAGGGSVCYFDGHKLCVGPESAGANPGPACYGAGGPLTITDVNLLLGRLDATQFGIPILIEKAQARLDELSEKMYQTSQKRPSDTDILRGLLTIANERMAEAIRKISIAKGYNPKDYALVAFGGAGGLHACDMARLLNIATIILPKYAGLLSAQGIQEAQCAFFAEEQTLHTLDDFDLNTIKKTFKKLEKKAFEKAAKEGLDPAQCYVHSRTLFLRLKGQEGSIDVPFNKDFIDKFKQKYTLIYGSWLDNRPIEIEILRLSIREKKLSKPAVKLLSINEQHIPKPHHFTKSFVGDSWQNVPVYLREALTEGSKIEGFALLLDRYSTTVIESGYTLVVQSDGTAIMQYSGASNTATTTTEHDNTVELALFTNRFQSIATEMGAMLQRSALSVNVKERLDFSCALLDSKGYLVANAPHIPVHLGSLGVCIRTVLQHLEMQDGDTVITNHPAFGGSHLPDVTLITKVASDTAQLEGGVYLCNRCHHAEIGGIRPGSMPPFATRLIEEGVVFKPTFLVQNGAIQWSSIESILTQAPYPTRHLAENIADLKAALAANLQGARAVKSLAASHGWDKIRFYMNALQNYTAARIKAALESRFTEGVYEAEEYLDDGSILKVAVFFNFNAINKAQLDKVVFDFTGSAAVHQGNLNATRAIVHSVVIYILRLLLRENIPLNEGIMQIVEIILPNNSILNPRFSDDDALNPAVVGGNVETSQRLTDTLIKALSIMACGQGTMNNVLFGNDTFGYYETICGGSGAGEGFDGTSGVHTHMTNTRITDPEILELRYPVVLESFGMRLRSGGKGQFTGGNGIIRRLRFTESVALSILSQHRRVAPFGLAGGAEGKRGKQYIINLNGKKIPLKGNDTYSVTEGEVFVIETPGGGGYGVM